MKKSFSPLSLIATTIILFTACKKDGSSPDGNGTNFNPMSPGSTWTYKHTETGVPTTNFTLTATNRDTTANGKTYKVFTNSAGQNGYFAKVGNDDYRFASFASYGIPNFEELFLKEDKGVNESWTNQATVKLSGLDVTATMNYVIRGKGETRTVNGKTFNNVTHVRVDINFILGSVGGGDFYYQEGVGMIEDNISISQPVSYTAKDELVSYEIK